MDIHTSGDYNEANDLGRMERSLLLCVQGPQPRLEYPTEPLEMGNGCVVEKYVIPEADREKVLSELYPFVDVPEMDATLLDLHTDTFFRVGDYLAIREGDLNFLAAPKYAEAGGTVLDWIDPDSTETAYVLKRELLDRNAEDGDR